MRNKPQGSPAPVDVLEAARRDKIIGAVGRADQIFAARFRAAREAAGYTQRDIATLMTRGGFRMHQTAVAKLEAGQRPVLIGEAAVLAFLVGTTLPALLGEAAGRDSAADDRVMLVRRRLRLQRDLDQADAAADQLRQELAEVESQMEAAK